MTALRAAIPCVPLFLLLIASPSQSQENETEAQMFSRLPDTEFSLNSAFAWTEDDTGLTGDSFTASVAGNLGFAVTDFELGIEPVSTVTLQVGPVVDFAFTDIDTGPSTGNFDLTLLNAGPRVTANLLTDSRVVPFTYFAGGLSFVRAELGTFDESEVGGFWEFGGGIRVFLAEYASLNTGLSYQQTLFGGDIDVDIDIFALTFGISFFFDR